MAYILLIFSLFLLSAGGARLVAEEAPDWSTISVLFTERCVMCHSAQAAALDLRLDSYEGAIAGGVNGPVLVPGNAAGSELVRRLRGESLPRMPFLSYALAPEQIEIVERWIETGLPERLEPGSATERVGPPARAVLFRPTGAERPAR